MVKHLSSLQPFGDDGELRVVVEVPRGSTVKLVYGPKLKGFIVSRCLLPPDDLAAYDDRTGLLAEVFEYHLDAIVLHGLIAPVRTAVKELGRSTLLRTWALPQAALPSAVRPSAIHTDDRCLFSTGPSRWTVSLRSRDAQAQGS